MIPILLVGAACAGTAYALDRMALLTLRPERQAVDRTPEELGETWAEVSIPSMGVDLYGWWAEPSTPDPSLPVAVLVHGWTANTGVVIPLARTLLRAGYPVLAVDARGHGLSPDVPFLTLRHYRDDVTSAVHFACGRWEGRSVLLAGHSMGASACCLVAAERRAPVHGLVLISAPADLLEVTQGWMRDNGLRGSALIPLLLPFWRRRAGEPWRTLHPERRAADVSVPTVVAQGTEDARVPPSHAARMARQVGVEALFVAGADHMGVLERPELHERVLALGAKLRS